jgi:Holliday junction resolvase
MAKKSRTKGYRGERELAEKLEGKRTSRIGEASPDVTAGARYGTAMFEVKRRKKSFTTLYDAMQQAYDLGNHLVAVRDDRREWLVVMPLDEWKREHENPVRR